MLITMRCGRRGNRAKSFAELSAVSFERLEGAAMDGVNASNSTMFTCRAFSIKGLQFDHIILRNILTCNKWKP